MLGRILFFLFLGVGVLEVGAFIVVGGLIGVPLTLLLIVLTAVIGSILLKKQGLETFIAGKQALDRGEVPLKHILDGLALVAAGALLLTPGFITDALGFLLFVPKVRAEIGQRIAKLFVDVEQSDKAQSRQRQNPDVIDIEATVLDDQKPRN